MVSCRRFGMTVTRGGENFQPRACLSIQQLADRREHQQNRRFRGRDSFHFARGISFCKARSLPVFLNG
jgi:hypothetical protein